MIRNISHLGLRVQEKLKIRGFQETLSLKGGKFLNYNLTDCIAQVLNRGTVIIHIPLQKLYSYSHKVANQKAASSK